MSFIPRSTFPFPSRAPTWFVGHMSKGLRKMRESLSVIDLVLEIRDARLPLTTINPEFEKLFGSDKGFLPKNGKKRLVVYNKRDLAEPGLEIPIQRALLQHAGQLCLFADSASDRDIAHVLKIATTLAHPEFPATPTIKPEALRFMICGMPNVGKSSILNALRRVGVRKGKAAQTGSNAGITRKLTGTVKVWEDPPTYVYDTPGVMMPYFGEGEEAAEKGIKLALTSGLKENLYDPLTLADYLLFRINQRYFHPSYPTLIRDLPPFLQPYHETLPTNDIHVLLQAVGQRTGALQPGGIVDEDFAARLLVRAFRQGKMGLWALDDMGLLFSGNQNTPSLPAPAGETETSIPKLLAERNAERTLMLPEPYLQESMALLAQNSNLPNLIAPDSPTSLQISSFVSSYTAAQSLSLTELSTSKNQIKKRALLAASEKREQKWRAKHPNLSSRVVGSNRGKIGGGRKGQGVFFVGGKRFRRKLEKKRSIARKVAKKRAKMR